VAEGWQPLCDFLGVPVPADTEFPHANDTKEFQRYWRGRMARLLIRPALALAGAAVALRLLTRRRSR
jgi:hypothetical protein